MQARACKCQSDKEEASQRFQLLQIMGPAPKRIAVLSIATFRSILTSPDLRDARCQPRLSIEKAQNAGHVRRRCQHKPVQACQPVRRPMSKQHGWRRGTAVARAAVARLWVRRGGGHDQSLALRSDAQAGTPLVAAAVESRARGRYTALSRVPVHSGGWTPAEGSTFTGHNRLALDGSAS